MIRKAKKENDCLSCPCYCNSKDDFSGIKICCGIKRQDEMKSKSCYIPMYTRKILLWKYRWKEHREFVKAERKFMREMHNWNDKSK